MEFRMVREAGPLKFNSGGPFVNACLPLIQDFLVMIHKEVEQHCTDGEDVGQNAGHRDISWILCPEAQLFVQFNVDGGT